jgi:hypothetical protein
LAGHNASQKYQDFISAVQKYGTSPKEFLCGLGFNETVLLKHMLKGWISRWRGTRKVEVDTSRTRENSGNGRKRLDRNNG